MNSFPCLLHFIAFFEVVRGCPRVKAKCSILLRILVNHPSFFVYIWKTAGKIIHITQCLAGVVSAHQHFL